jgi:hypothetical protein
MSLRSVVDAIASKGCQCLWQGYAKGTTCLQIRAHAARDPDAFIPEYRLRLVAGEHLCEHCQLQQALDEDERTTNAMSGP